MSLQAEFDALRASLLAAELEQMGMTGPADELWREISNRTAYDREARARYGEIMYQARQREFPHGSVVRSRFLLHVMGSSFPTQMLIDAYFENLRALFSNHPRQDRPGKVVLGTGAGRCGSTTLAAAFAGLRDACSTHENPPKIYWEPREEQVRFHMDRLRLLTQYCAIVFDAAHWWTRVLDRFFAEFPGGKVVGLVRETDSCVRSFLKFQGRGQGSTNHWAPPHNELWQTTAWDPTYPCYPVPPEVMPGTDESYATKVAMVTRYVSEYNQSLRSLVETDPRRILLVNTEEMNEAATEERLSAFVGERVRMPSVALNVGTNLDGAQPYRWL
jgi:hypothetical protein